MHTTHTAEEIAEMAAAAKACKDGLPAKKAEFQARVITYDDLFAYAQRYCDLFAAWSKAKYPTGKNEHGRRIPRPDPRALIR